jgi:Tol biopolymer transport system component
MTERMAEVHLDREIGAFLAWQADDVAGAPSASQVAARVRERTHGRGAFLGDRYQPRLALALLVAALLALVIGAAAFVGGRSPHLPASIQNGWIAFSSQPGYRQAFPTDWAEGGDIYLLREGVAPRKIVDRGPTMNSNVCPRFSPDGSKLVYGELAGDTAALVVLEVADDGTVTESERFEVPGVSSVAPCPRWSRNGTHVVYLDGIRWDQDGHLASPGTAVRVLDLDGVAVDPTADDPSIEDLRRSGTFDPLNEPDGSGPFRSPDGGLRATCREHVGLVVGPPDGSADRKVALGCGYSRAAWSPDGHRILVLSDGGRTVSLGIVSVTGSTGEGYIGNVPINGARQFPGRGDVSWQSVQP